GFWYGPSLIGIALLSYSLRRDPKAYVMGGTIGAVLTAMVVSVLMPQDCGDIGIWFTLLGAVFGSGVNAALCGYSRGSVVAISSIIYFSAVVVYVIASIRLC